MTVQQISEEHVRGPGWLGRARRGGPAAVVVRLSRGDALLARVLPVVVLGAQLLTPSRRDR